MPPLGQILGAYQGGLDQVAQDEKVLATAAATAAGILRGAGGEKGAHADIEIVVGELELELKSYETKLVVFGVAVVVTGVLT